MKTDFGLAQNYLCSKDPILAKIIKKIELRPILPADNYFQKLTESIISQQLSVKAADTITSRFVALFGTGAFPLPEQVLQMDQEKIRGVGISYQKITYIKDLSKYVSEKLLNFHLFGSYSDEEVILHLTEVRGIGRWTAEMFLMFALARPDVFSYGDLGLKNAIYKLYKLKNHPNVKQAKKISDTWIPNRTLACRYLWASLEVDFDL